MWLTLCWQDSLSQLTIQPKLHADKGLAAFLCQLAPWLWPGQHVADTPLGETQHLKDSSTKGKTELAGKN